MNPEPDISQEEFEKSIAAKGQVEMLEGMRKKLLETFSPIVPDKRYTQVSAVGSGRTKTEFVVFEGCADKISKVSFFSGYNKKPPRAVLWGLDFPNQQHKLCDLLADGTIENFDVIQRTAYLDEQGDEFKRDFIKSMLKRLNLTAADLPGINLEPVLGKER